MSMNSCDTFKQKKSSESYLEFNEYILLGLFEYKPNGTKSFNEKVQN